MEQDDLKHLYKENGCADLTYFVEVSFENDMSHVQLFNEGAIIHRDAWNQLPNDNIDVITSCYFKNGIWVYETEFRIFNFQELFGFYNGKSHNKVYIYTSYDLQPLSFKIKKELDL